MKYCKIKTIIVFSTVLILLSSCSNKSETESKENESKSENTSYVFESVDTEDTSTEEISTDEAGNIIQEEESKFPRPEYKINKANIYKMKDEVSINCMDIYGVTWIKKFKINNVTISSELPEGITKEQVNYFDEKTNENGTLLNNQYIFMDISVKNESQNEVVYYLNSGNFIELNDEMKVIDSTNEARYQSLYDTSKQGIKDYFRIILKPEEEIEVTIAYICNKSMAESDSIYYMLDGTDINSEDIKAFKIDIQK